MQVVPPTADQPTFSPNPMIGPNSVPPPTGGGEPATDPPGVTVRFRDRSTTGSFLVDTGAADSVLSVLLAIGSGAVSSLRRSNPYPGAFETCAFSEQSIEGTPVGTDFVFQRGEGYILYSRLDGAIRLPGCAN